MKSSSNLLVLGSGDSGKSTFIRQMRLTKSNGFTQEESAFFKLSIFQNICEILEALLNAIPKLNLEYEDTLKYTETLKEISQKNLNNKENEMIVKEFLNSKVVKECLNRKTEVPELQDTAQ
ncbi:hypothetical protein HK099_002744 [Clydaea vesicula]|uniref:Uncharacterized protein n=1 Tax=Clydaea vesicula TaxID=447962 RepID=A0AAD5TXE5_9FUNG|nr:hypothetical protein HK099_002744 [Clydaea vesicula]